MSNRKLMAITAVIALLGFLIVAVLYSNSEKDQSVSTAVVDENILVRFHSPVFGPQSAPVTIVEFFDPACEACRAFHPIVKQIMGEFPGKVRVVLRYAAFHNGSDTVVRILEAARLQNVFEPVLEALYETQPNWAIHGAPNLDVAWAAVAKAGLDVEQARQDMMRSEITAVLDQDAADIKQVGVKQTPTFFVNGKALPSFGVQQLYDLVVAEVEATGS